MSVTNATEKGLPTNVDAERFVLGSILLDDALYVQAAGTLEPDDFSLQKHRLIFRRMGELQDRAERIDRVTVANELMKFNELEACDGLSYLVSLDDGLPYIPNLDSYIRIVKDKAVLRRIILSSQNTIKRCVRGEEETDQILRDHLVHIEALRGTWSSRQTIHRIEDLKSIFANRAAVEYLINPELPKKAVVCLTGDSESGKTTLACAWAREVLHHGNSVLILD